MTIKTSGALSISDIVAEFGGSAPHSLSEYYAGGSYVHSGAVGINGAIPSSGAISLDKFYGANKLIPGNSGIITSGSSYTLPLTCGTTIKVLLIGGGGGGGGGTARTAGYDGYNNGGGGGAAGGNAYGVFSVTPGETVTYTISPAGAAGSSRDGIYSSGSSGTTPTAGSFSTASFATLVANGGTGGSVSPDGSAAAAGTNTGFQILTATNGGASSYLSGGTGAKGYTIDTTVGLSLGSILGYGTSGAPGGYNSGTPAQSGTVYGAGGGGGGVNPANSNVGKNAANGTAGALFIWWGY